MKQAEAEARLDELLDGVAEIAREGRCPHCEAIPSEAPAKDKLLFLPTPKSGPDELKMLGVPHAKGCPLRGSGSEIQRLVDRFGFKIESKLVEAPPRGVFISGYRAGRRGIGIEGPDSIMTVPLERAKCDICSEEGVVSWRYPCDDFTTPEGRSSEGPWEVCDRCHELVESEQLAEMLRLGTAQFAAITATLNEAKRAQFFKTVGEFQRQFMKNRMGPAQRIET